MRMRVQAVWIRPLINGYICIHLYRTGYWQGRHPYTPNMNPSDNYQTTFDSKTKIVVFYSLNIEHLIQRDDKQYIAQLRPPPEIFTQPGMDPPNGKIRPLTSFPHDKKKMQHNNF